MSKFKKCKVILDNVEKMNSNLNNKCKLINSLNQNNKKSPRNFPENDLDAFSILSPRSIISHDNIKNKKVKIESSNTIQVNNLCKFNKKIMDI